MIHPGSAKPQVRISQRRYRALLLEEEGHRPRFRKGQQYPHHNVLAMSGKPVINNVVRMTQLGAVTAVYHEEIAVRMKDCQEEVHHLE